MADVNNSPNMNLTIPVTGQEPGPNWANDYNNSLGIVDGHNHAPGSGVQINPDGININANLAFNDFAAVSLAYTAYVIALSQPAGLTTLYAFGTNGELYWNDGAGNKVKITSGGVVNATSSGISSGTANASFASSILVVTQSVGVGAAIDAATYILRYNGSYPSPSGNYILLAAPSSLSGGYQLTFPATVSPSNGTLLTSSSAGVLTYSTPDQVGQAMTSTGANAIANSRTRATGSTVAAGGVAISSSSGGFNTASLSAVAVTNLSVTITTTGRPVFIGIVADETASASQLNIGTTGAGTNQVSGVVFINKGSTNISQQLLASSGASSASLDISVPTSSILVIDFPTAGTYTYSITVQNLHSSQLLTLSNSVLVAYEL